MKACKIYKTKKNYKIITLYKTDTGTYISNSPVYILPISSNIEEFGKLIKDSLTASNLIPYPKENFSTQLLKDLKESSFKKLYANSTSCGLFLNKEKLEIITYKCINPEEGLDEDSEKIQYFDYDELNKIKLGEIVSSILNESVIYS